MDSKLQKLLSKWSNLSIKVNKACIEYLTDLLHNNNNRICLDRRDLYSSVCVNYDGGNHPDWASNVFSTVYSIFIEDNNIYLEIADCEKYDINNLSICELYNVCTFIDKYVYNLNQDEFKAITNNEK